MSGALLPLRARHCLITGAYGGIGAAIAARFAAEGALVTLLGRKEDKLRELCAQLPPFRDTRLSPLTAGTASTRTSPDDKPPAHSYSVMDVSADGRDEAVLDDIWVRIPFFFPFFTSHNCQISCLFSHLALLLFFPPPIHIHIHLELLGSFN